MSASNVVAGLDAGAKAEILVEALPYIRRFWHKVVVVKFGGNALGDGSALADFATDIVLMRSVGMRPLVVHGGGPQIGELMARLGKQSEFRQGLRVTDAETLDIARMVLVGKVNRDIVAAINVHGPLAVGVSGEDAGLIQAVPLDPELGFVGDITQSVARVARPAAGRGPGPGGGHHRERRNRPGLQHQRRHRGRRHRQGAGRRKAGLSHRCRGHPGRSRTTRQACSASSTRASWRNSW